MITQPAISLVALAVALAPMAAGYFIYKERIPNGRIVPHPCKFNYLWAGVGHLNLQGGGDLNAFGEDFKAHGAEWTPELCRLDSDGDGLTNGQELGDPDCVWTPDTAPNRTTSLTHPGWCDPWGDPSCGDNNADVDCELGTFQCEVIHEPGMQNISLRLPVGSPVSAQDTTYNCMTFDLPDDDVYHLVAMEPYIDNAQVIHHMLIASCDDVDDPPEYNTPVQCVYPSREGCNNVFIGWTVGMDGECLKNMGVRFGKGYYNRVMIQFHWNNPELRADYTDSSGVILHYTRKLRPISASMLYLGQHYLEIPPLTPSVEIAGLCNSMCTNKILNQSIYVYEAYNHMHLLGIKQRIELIRDGEIVALITDNQDFNYDRPLPTRHDPPIEVRPGDELKTVCTFNSMSRTVMTYYNESTSGEMCVGYLGVFPSEAMPITTMCIGYKSFSFCDVLPKTSRPATTLEPLNEECDLSKFTDLSAPYGQQLTSSVRENCVPFGQCTSGCQQVFDSLKTDPCMYGDNLGTLKTRLFESHEGMLMLAGLDSCMRIASNCPACQNCHRSIPPTSSATTSKPHGFVLAVTVFTAALWSSAKL